jgi:hypothetical protein
MHQLMAFFSGLLCNEWRDITSAPFDCEIELASIDGAVALAVGPCLRHENDWLDTETLKPINVVATHWRYRRPELPTTCC